MAIRIKITGFKELQTRFKNIGKPLGGTALTRIGQGTITQMKKMILAGSSPIKGEGRFPAYKNPKRYPGKRKASKPVNLKLSGKFLKSLKFLVKTGRTSSSVTVGYGTRESALKETGHREGANTQPRRPTIPDIGAGEEFNTTISKLIVKLVTAAVRKRTRG